MITRAVVLALILLTAGTAFAEEKGGGDKATPIELPIQFMTTGRGRPRIWLTVFKINAAKADDLNHIHAALPRIIDEVIVRMTSGRPTGHDPEIADVKQAATDGIQAQVGTVEGLEVSVLKLGQMN